MNQDQLDLLTRHINEFDCYYEMSDSNAAYMPNRIIEKKINEQLKTLTPENIKIIENNLNRNGKECFKRYFNKHD